MSLSLLFDIIFLKYNILQQATQFLRTYNFLSQSIITVPSSGFEHEEILYKSVRCDVEEHNLKLYDINVGIS